MFLNNSISALLAIAIVGIILTALLTKRSFVASTTILAMFSCLALLNSCHNTLLFVIALEGYNLCYILFLFINNANKSAIERLLLLSMSILSIMVFGLCSLQVYPTSIIGKSLILMGLLFKLGVVPFHTWILDLYDHASFRIIAITDGVLKIMLATVFVHILPCVNTELLPILRILGYISLVVGSTLALYERNIKRWIGSLSIGHVGIIMCTAGVASSNVSTTALLYLVAYGTCVVVFCISKNNIFKVTILCSMVGLPPFHTFLVKINLIKDLLNNSCAYTLLAIMIYFIIELISTIRWIIHFFEQFSKLYTKN